MLKVYVTEMVITYFKTRFNVCSQRTEGGARWQLSVPMSNDTANWSVNPQ